jgi:hypothetical protein
VYGEVPSDPPERLRRLEAFITSTLLISARQAGVTLPEGTIRTLLQMDVTLNAQGIDVWLSKSKLRKSETNG